MRQIILALTSVLVLSFVLAADPTAQSKPTLKPADYDQFESVSPAAGRGGLSPDGKWFAYTRHESRRRQRTAHHAGRRHDVEDRAVCDRAPVYASNSQWIAYSIGAVRGRAERLRAARQPVQRKLGLLNLVDQHRIDRRWHRVVRVRSDGPVDGDEAVRAGRRPRPAAPRRRRLRPRRRPRRRRRRAGDAAPRRSARRCIVRNLATGADMTFGNVTEFAWQPTDDGRLLAMIISADGQAGNGVQVYDAATSVLRVLESTPTDYSALVWRDDSSDLLVLKAKTDDKRDGPTQVVLAWIGRRHAERNTARRSITRLDNVLPATQRIVTFRRPSWLTGRPELGPDDSARRRRVADEAGAAGRRPRQRARAATARRDAGAAAAANDKARRGRVALERRASSIPRRSCASPPTVAAICRPSGTWPPNKLVVHRQVVRRERVADSEHARGAGVRVHAVPDGAIDRPRRRGLAASRIMTTGARTPLKTGRRRQRLDQHRRQVRDLRGRRPLLDDQPRDEGRHEHHGERSRRRSSTSSPTARRRNGRCSASPAGQKTMSPSC